MCLRGRGSALYPPGCAACTVSYCSCTRGARSFAHAAACARGACGTWHMCGTRTRMHTRTHLVVCLTGVIRAGLLLLVLLRCYARRTLAKHQPAAAGGGRERGQRQPRRCRVQRYSTREQSDTSHRLLLSAVHRPGQRLHQHMRHNGVDCHHALGLVVPARARSTSCKLCYLLPTRKVQAQLAVCTARQAGGARRHHPALPPVAWAPKL